MVNMQFVVFSNDELFYPNNLTNKYYCFYFFSSLELKHFGDIPVVFGGINFFRFTIPFF